MVHGGAREDRTPDLLLAKQVLSQLSYGPFEIPVNGISFSVVQHPCLMTETPSAGEFSSGESPRVRLSLMNVPANIVANSIANIVVGLGGFEPPTSPLSGVRSNQLSYRPPLT